MAAIHLGLPLPAGSCGLPAGSGEQPSNACAGRCLAAAAFLGLAPGGVYLATPVTRGAGELLPHRFTLTGWRAWARAGGLFSPACEAAARIVKRNRATMTACTLEGLELVIHTSVPTGLLLGAAWTAEAAARAGPLTIPAGMSGPAF